MYFLGDENFFIFDGLCGSGKKGWQHTEKGPASECLLFRGLNIDTVNFHRILIYKEVRPYYLIPYPQKFQ
jgi:hypothetical protein